MKNFNIERFILNILLYASILFMFWLFGQLIFYKPFKGSVHDSVFCERYYLNNDLFYVPNDCLKYDLKNYCSVYLESNVKDIPFLCFDYFTSLKK